MKYKVIVIAIVIIFLISISPISATNDTNDNLDIHDNSIDMDQNTKTTEHNTVNDTAKTSDNSNIKQESMKTSSNNYQETTSADKSIKKSSQKTDTNQIQQEKTTTSQNTDNKTSTKTSTSNTYYVSTEGKSSNDGSSITNAWDIQTGLNNIQNYNNSNLIINSGTYKVNQTTTINSSISNFYTEISTNGKVTFNASEEILKIATGNTVKITNITFNNGYTSNNGGVFVNEGTLEIVNCSFNNNTALYKNGGVVYNNNTLIVTNSLFDNNHASNGGAIYNIGEITVINSSFNNHNLSNGRSGGAIYNNNQATIINTKFCNDTCNFNGGGALFNNGTCIFNESYAENCYGLHGGAIYNSGNITVNDSVFINNTSLIGSAIYNTNTATINRNKMQQNCATTSGGALYNMGQMYVNSTNITSNYATTGGGLYNALGTIEIENCNISNNSANQAGAIYNKKNLLLNNNIFENNIANDTGGIYNTYSQTEHQQEGASFTLYSTGNITGQNNVFTNNSNLDKNSIASTIQNYGYLNLTNSTFSKNTNINDVLIYNNNTTLIYEYEDTVLAGTIILNGNTFNNFTKLATNYGNMIIINNTITYAKDGIIDNYGTLELRSNIITNNTLNTSKWIINNVDTTDVIITDNIFNNNTKNNQDVLLNDNNYTLVSNNTYIGNMLNCSLVLDNTISSYNINVSLKVRNVYNSTVNNGLISIYDKYNNVVASGNLVNGSVNISLTASLVKTGNFLTVTYTSNDKSFQTVNSTVNLDIPIKSTTITLDPISSMIGENITLKATVLDSDNNPVTGGNLVFKLNGKTLRVDGSFNSTADPLKFSVVNGTVSYTLTADLYLRNAKNLTASYSGSTYYTESKSDVVELQLAKRSADIDVVASPTIAKEDQTIEFTVNITDTKRPETTINDGYVIFKINDKTLYNEDGSKIQKSVSNNTATFSYVIPRSTASVDSTNNLRNYSLTAIYVNDDYYSVRNYTQYNIEKSEVTIDVKDVVISNSKMNITALITNENNNTVVGNNKICIKVNDKTLRDSNDNPIYYTVTDGVIDLSDITIQNSKVENITVVTGQRQAYTSAQTTYTNIRIL